MLLKPPNSSILEQLALKGLTGWPPTSKPGENGKSEGKGVFAVVYCCGYM